MGKLGAREQPQPSSSVSARRAGDACGQDSCRESTGGHGEGDGCSSQTTQGTGSSRDEKRTQTWTLDCEDGAAGEHEAFCRGRSEVVECVLQFQPATNCCTWPWQPNATKTRTWTKQSKAIKTAAQPRSVL